MRWSVVVTTAPRKEPTLQECIDSLLDCGWEPTILAEPDSPLPNYPNILQNQEVMGVWRNWVLSVKTALETDAEVIMTVQDDSLFHPDSKEFVESVMWPSESCGFISLYTPKHYTIRDSRLLRKNPKADKLRPVGVNRIVTKSLWGACALVFPRKVLEHIINLPLIHSWAGAPPRSGNPKVLEKRRENPHLIANSDTAIGKLMNNNGYSMWFVDPSPVQHIAKYSAMGHGDNSGRRNAYRIADHTIPLRDQVFPNENSHMHPNS